MTVRLRAGVIGLGVGEQHIAGYRSHPACQVVALCDRDPAKQAMARERYPDLTIHAEADDLIDDPVIDVVSIASFDDDHHRQIVRAVERGKHVFAEKPLCLSVSELADIRRAFSRRSDLRLSCNFILRGSPRFRDLRERLRRGELGRLFYLEGDYNYGRLHKLTEGWRGRIGNYSVTLGGGLHLIDLLLWLTGGRVIEVSAFGNGICSAGTAFASHDMVAALLRFNDGMLAKITSNYGCIFPHFHRLMLYGTAATFENGLPDAKLYHSRDPGVPPQAITTSYPGTAKGDLIPSFIDAILGTGRAEVENEDIFAAMSVALAIDRAAQGGTAVAVEYI